MSQVGSLCGAQGSHTPVSAAPILTCARRETGRESCLLLGLSPKHSRSFCIHCVMLPLTLHCCVPLPKRLGHLGSLC